MDWLRIATYLERLIPAALILGLIGDWLRLRFAYRAEERKHIARAISDLLQLRYIVMSLPEIPKLAHTMLPKELRDQIPQDIWRSIDFAKAIPMDDEFPKRYPKAVEEISGFRPVLAYQLHDKERHFDLRNVVLQHFSQAPGSPLVASGITEVVDREALAALEETLSLLAKAHSMYMRYSIWRKLRSRPFQHEIIPPALRNVFQEQVNQMVAAASSQTAEAGSRSFSKSGDFIPSQQTFEPGVFASALKSIVESLDPKAGTVRLFASIQKGDGTSIQIHNAKFKDLNPVVQPGSDLGYMELSFEGETGIHYQITASFYGVAWWLGLNANRGENLSKLWELLCKQFGLYERSRNLERESQNRRSEDASVPSKSPAAQQVVRLVESKLRAAMRKSPVDERAVQDIVEILLLGAEVSFSRELESIEYSSRSYRPDFTLRDFELVIETKFCSDPTREKSIIQEINDDILAYRTKFKNLLFVVYDVGCIRDTAKFCAPFQEQEGVHIRIIKH